jgi:predicted nucleic acid-binding protein
VTFVVDASVVLAWSFDDEQSVYAETVVGRMLTEGGIAPAHWPLEVANAIRSAERRGRIASTDIPKVLALLQGLPVEIVPVELGTSLGLLEMAGAHDLSIYDAVYVELAAFRGLDLATIDERVAAACRTVGVPLIQ